MKVLMVGVSPSRKGGMWAMAKNYLENKEFCKITNLEYVSTSTSGSIIKRSMHMFIGIIKILRILVLSDIDIVHVHMSKKGSVFRKGLVIVISKLFCCKIIVHMHAGGFTEWYKTQPELLKKIIRYILSLSDELLVLGEYWREKISEIIPNQNIEVLYNGIKIPEENPYNVDSHIIIFMGMMNKEKGIFDLLESIKLIDSILPQNIHVLLCGDDENGLVQRKIDELELINRVKCLGWIDETKKKDIYKNAMLNVLPSYYEGLSMTVIEAMANGIPTIATNISTMPEVLGDSGILIDPGDIDSLANAIVFYSNNVSLRKEISNDVYKIAKDRFNIERNIEMLLNKYSKLCIKGNR